jgi:hypothetical protein
MRIAQRIAIILLWLAAAMTAPTIAQAQTAEETVVFMLFGYEKENIDHPLAGKISIVRQTNCNYSIVIERLPQKLELTFDFSGLKEYQVRRGPNGLDPIIVGNNILSVKGEDGALRNSDTFSATMLPGVRPMEALKIAWPSADRLEKAVAYFRMTFCKGRAF